MGKNQTSIKPGEIRNPKGRPKDGESMTALLNEYLKGTDSKTKKQRRQILIEKIYKKAVDGDKGALTYIFDRMDGKPKEQMNISGNEDSSIRVVFDFDRKNSDDKPTT